MAPMETELKSKTQNQTKSKEMDTHDSPPRNKKRSATYS